MPLHLFIDTNILLSFFHLSSDDLEELRKLVALIRNQAIRLHLPDHVKDEFSRNRENKILDALKRLQDQKLNLQFPQFCKDYPEYEVLRDAQRAYETAHTALLTKLRADIASEGLKADLVIRELFASAAPHPISQQAYACARYRVDVGNPPGKNGSLGDALNWEVLLENVPQGEDLWFVTEDGDYASPLDANSFQRFLLDEWHAKKSSRLVFHRRLSAFFKEKYPQIEIATGVEKEIAIAELASSWSYANTHTAVAKLEQFADFTPAQATAIAAAAVSNSQIYWIIEDEDVKQLLLRILSHHGASIDPAVRDALREKLAEGTGASASSA
jgi:predicted nucleic acid-binding protein